MKNKLLLLVSILFCAGLSAQNLSGSWGYKIDGKYVKLYGDKIQNQNNGGTSGTLKVALWATKYPYNGGTINGLAFSKTCRPEPYGDLLRQHNPTCFIESYQGGLSCCHQKNVFVLAVLFRFAVGKP